MKPKGSMVMVVVGGGGAGRKPGSSAPCPHCGGMNQEEDENMLEVPVSALAGLDESGESGSPAVGDSFTLNEVQGVVSSIEGDMAQVEITSVNGESLVAEATEEVSERDALLDSAMKEDEGAAAY